MKTNFLAAAVIAIAGVGIATMTIQGEPPAATAPAAKQGEPSELQMYLEMKKNSKAILEQLKVVAEAFEKEPMNGRPFPEMPLDVEKFCLALKGLPMDDPAVIEAVALARKCVDVEPVKVADEGLNREQLRNLQRHKELWRQNKMIFGWKVLMAVKVLKPGLSVAEAVALLGKPTWYGPDGKDKPTQYLWITGMTNAHVNPALCAQLKDGVVVGFKIGNY